MRSRKSGGISRGSRKYPQKEVKQKDQEEKVIDKVEQSLIEELEWLDNIIKRIEKSLENAPEGKLRISKEKNRIQFYNRIRASENNGKYISKKNILLVRQLAQKDYDKQVLVNVKIRREKIKEILEKIKSTDISKIYQDIPIEKQNLITPYILTDEQFIKSWNNKTYKSKGFMPDTPEIYTEKGERVRSKSEKILADKFNLMKIPYHYEYPLKLKGYGIIYPDFLVLNKRTRKEYYFEHFGLMDNPEYCRKAIKKIETYNKNGIFEGEQLITTYETSKDIINIKNIERLIRKYFL